jgi:hypothetical protein
VPDVARSWIRLLPIAERQNEKGSRFGVARTKTFRSIWVERDVWLVSDLCSFCNRQPVYVLRDAVFFLKCKSKQKG